MSTETARIEIAAPADEVWGLIGEFGGLDTWMAGVDSCEVDGDVRTVGTMGMKVQEQLVARDPEARTLTYSIVGEGAPVDEHRATISVAEADDGASVVTWAVTVVPVDATGMFKDIYQGALGHLKTHLEG